jgi:acetyl-CoA carboxylase biotin carboxyl carrier protein
MTQQPGGPDNESNNWDEQIEFLRGLAHIVRDESLNELSVEADGVRLSLKSAAPGATVVLVSAPGAQPAPGGAAPAASDAGVVPIVSPMVGVFYRAPSPNDPSFIEIGDNITAGQVVGVVEAMKVFNEITSDIEGTVVEIPAQNAELVETGAPLVLVRKS